MRLRNFCFRTPWTTAVAFVTTAFLGAPLVVQADPIVITATNVWRADRSPNPIGFPSLAVVPWISVNTLPGGDVSQTQVTATNGSSSYALQRIATGPLAGIYFTQIPYDPSMIGDWIITATNGLNSMQTTRPGFIPVDPMPYVSSIWFTGEGTDITVHWDVTAAGELRLDEQQVSIWDITNPTPQTVQSFAIGADPREVHLTNLAIGRTYAVEVTNGDRNSTTGFIDAFSGNWLSGWTTTDGEVQLPVSVPEPASAMLVLAGLAIGARRRRRRLRSQAS